MPTIFFLGATGFIGGTVIVTLHKEFPEYTFKALVRSESGAIEGFKAIGVPIVPVKGTFADAELITQQAYEADIVVNVGDSGDIALKNAILRGFKKRFDEGKGVGSLIHTSGTMIYSDGSQDGKFNPNGKVWTDNEDDVKALTEKMYHGELDVPLLRAQEEGFFNAFILVPSITHGTCTGPVKTKSAFFKSIARDALVRKKVGYVGEGSNVSGAINVEDLASLYALTFKVLVDAKGKRLDTSPYERYIIASAEEYTFKTMATVLAAEMYKLGQVDSPEPVSMTVEEFGGFLGSAISPNYMYRPVRAASLGWVPSHDKFASTVAEQLKLF